MLIIGPATVGGIVPACFRIGNTGGMLDNILFSKLWRTGSVAYVSKSGGARGPGGLLLLLLLLLLLRVTAVCMCGCVFVCGGQACRTS